MMDEKQIKTDFKILAHNLASNRRAVAENKERIDQVEKN